MAERLSIDVARRRSGPIGLASRRQVRMPELVVGVVLVVGAALGAVLWHGAVTSGDTVVVAARDVPRGAVLTADDLAPVEVRGASGLDLVPGASAAELVGRITLVDVAAGTPWSPGLLGEIAPLQADEALVALAVAPGEAPPDLSAGDLVKVVVVTPGNLDAPATAELRSATATVWQLVPPGELGPDAVVTLRVPLTEAVVVSAAEEVRLVRVEARG
jgi:hypothetical protein